MGENMNGCHNGSAAFCQQGLTGPGGASFTSIVPGNANVQINIVGGVAQISSTLQAELYNATVNLDKVLAAQRQISGSTLDARRPSATNQQAYDALLSTILEAAPNAVAQVYLPNTLGAIGSAGTTWPASNFGGSALTHQGAAAPYTVGIDEKTGHKCLVSTTTADRSLVLAAGTYKSVIVVYSTEEYVPPDITMLAFTAVSVYPLFANAPTLHWQNQLGTGQATQWLDGVNEPNGAPWVNDGRPHVLEGERSTNVTAGITIGGRLGFNYSPRGKLFAVILLRETLTSAQRATITDAAIECFEIPGPHALIVDGNSIALGHPNAVPATPSRSVLVPGVALYSLAVSATTIDQAIARMATSFDTIRFSSCSTKWVWFYEICNSLAPSVGNQTDTQCLASLRTYVAGIRALGCKVLMSTCMPGLHVTAPVAEGYRLSVNTVLRAQTWGSLCEYGDELVDFAALPEAANIANLTYFRADQIHPTDYLYSVMWAILRNRHASIVRR